METSSREALTWEGESLRLCLPFFFLEPRGVAAVPPPPPPPLFSMKLRSSSTERSSCCRFSSSVSIGAAPSLISFCSSSRRFCSSWAPHRVRRQHLIAVPSALHCCLFASHKVGIGTAPSLISFCSSSRRFCSS